MNLTAALRKAIRSQILQSLQENDNYPAGAAHDSSAPWNQSDNPEVKKYSCDYSSNQIGVELTNGRYFQVSFIDFFERYWEQHPGSFQEHDKLFGADEASFDDKLMHNLEAQRADISGTLYNIADRRMLLGDEEPEPDFSL